MVVCAPALPWCWRCVCAGKVGAVQEGRAGKRQSVSQLPASLHQSAAEVRPLCGFGGRVSGRQERWAANKAGSRLLPLAWPRVGPPCCSWGCAHPALSCDRLTAGSLAWETPLGLERGTYGGCLPLRCFCFLMVGHPPMPLWEPLGEAGPAVPGGRQQGKTGESNSSSGERGCPSLPCQLKFGPGV